MKLVNSCWVLLNVVLGFAAGVAFEQGKLNTLIVAGVAVVIQMYIAAKFGSKK